MSDSSDIVPLWGVMLNFRPVLEHHATVSSSVTVWTRLTVPGTMWIVKLGPFENSVLLCRTQSQFRNDCSTVVLRHDSFISDCLFFQIKCSYEYSRLLFNKLSQCPNMVRKPSISVILHDRYPAIYVNDHIWKCTADFLSLLVWRPF